MPAELANKIININFWLPMIVLVIYLGIAFSFAWFIKNSYLPNRNNFKYLLHKLLQKAGFNYQGGIFNNEHRSLLKSLFGEKGKLIYPIYVLCFFFLFIYVLVFIFSLLFV